MEFLYIAEQIGRHWSVVVSVIPDNSCLVSLWQVALAKQGEN